MNTKHTPEPWVLNEFADIYDVDDSNGMLIAAVFPCEDLLLETHKANAARIVACVNACAGMEDPAAEIAALQERIAELEGRVPKKPEPNWDEAPEWAQWLAVDANGVAWWYKEKPFLDGLQWLPYGGCTLRTAGNVNFKGFDWRETLTPRP